MDPFQSEISKIEEPSVFCPTENLNSLSDCLISSKLEDYLTDNGGNDSQEETEPMSFVVLGKDSLDAIQASSLASYVDIQQKSMSVDYNSMISSLATSEVHKKLVDFLKENTELKETLKQNSSAMKKQFTVLNTWHNKLVNLQATHNKKFKETTSLINNLKKENLELKTKLAMQQTQDLETNWINLEAIVTANRGNNTTSTDKKFIILSQAEASALFPREQEKYASLNDLKSGLSMQQSEIKHNSETIDTASSFGSNNTSAYEVVTQIEASASCAPEEKEYALPDKQHISQRSCQDLKKEADCHVNMCNFQKLDNTYTKQKIMEQKSLLGNDERQIPREYDTSNENSFVKFEESNPTIDHINKLIYSIDKCDMDPACWNDGEYENNRMRYNNVMRELVKNFMEVINRCRVLTYCLRNIVTIFAPLERDIDEGTFGSNLELLKKKFVEYRTEASIYSRLTCPDNNINDLTLTFCDALKNVQDHVYNVFMDYRETLHMVYLMIDESLKMTDESADENSQDNPQEQAEVRQKLRILATQHDKMQKEKEELEKQKRELDTLSNSIENEKKRVQEIFMLRDQLIRRKNLYDGKLRALLDEKRTLIRDQKMDVTDLLEKYKRKDMECAKLQHQLDQSTSEIGLYKNQLTVYEEDFRQEKKVKELLLEEKSKLDEELGKQVNYNKKLLDRLSSSNIHVAPELASQYSPYRYCGLCRQYTSSFRFHGIGKCMPPID
ncbi:PREDICTED: uncharacterized protein LOC106743029 isoform X2 [Dinoponera quadriceps]|uniref:Uncharacterized protein LOC106743029 isoform X2 n=1 Tax=Dinoponera quadriceps TaxID=609295 RepID=A0A6P3X133_DINQU|nr:PREDICTED: uncharacterized protein LOC106743029 isoform X2 [Dinoponera quadriceps]